MIQSTLTGVAVLVMLFVVGCASQPSEQSPQETADTQAQAPGHAQHAPEESSFKHELLINTLGARKLGYSVGWATDIQSPAGNRIEHAVWLDELIVCVESPSNLVVAISAADGQILWSQVVGGKQDQLFAPAGLGKSVLVNSETQLYRLSAETGEVESVASLEHTATTSPVISGPFAIFGSMSGRVFAHDVTAGYSKWAYEMGDRILVRPVLSGPNVFVADASGVYAMLSAASGELLWRSRIFGRVKSQPAISPVGIFVASQDGALYSMNRATGRDRWIYRTTQPLTHDVAIVGNVVLLPYAGQGLIAIDERTGERLWSISDHQAKATIRIDDKFLLSKESSFLTVDAESGSVLEEIPVKPLRTVLTGPKDQLVLISPQGRLLLLSRIK